MNDPYGLINARRDVEEAENAPRRFWQIMCFVLFVWWPAAFLVAWLAGWGIFAE